ncbi:MAG: hypothetical protein ACKO96_27920, partial [Flammeovirgaceae bacterium]
MSAPSEALRFKRSGPQQRAPINGRIFRPRGGGARPPKPLRGGPGQASTIRWAPNARRSRSYHIYI